MAIRQRSLTDRPPIASPAPRPDEVFELYELRSAIEGVLTGLSPREAAIVRRYFGLEGGGGGFTLEEIGQQLRISATRVQQLKVRAMCKLRHPSQRRKLGAYVGLHRREEFQRFVQVERATPWATAYGAGREARRSTPQARIGVSRFE